MHKVEESLAHGQVFLSLVKSGVILRASESVTVFVVRVQTSNQTWSVPLSYHDFRRIAAALRVSLVFVSTLTFSLAFSFAE